MRRIFASAVLVSAAILATPAIANAASTGSIGPEQGLGPTADGTSATGEKPESKLFFTEDDTWWAALGTSKDLPPAVYLYRLDDRGWTPVFRLPGSDPWGKADTSYDAATHQLLVTLRDDADSTSDNPRQSLLYRLTYASGTWTSAADPVVVTTVAVEALTVAKDTVDRVWVAYERGGVIKAGVLVPGATTWKMFSLSTTNVDTDDVAAVVAYGQRIGVMWSDQESRRFLFASRANGAALTRASFRTQTAYGGGVGGCAADERCADDHVNIKTAGGTLYAAVKTSLNDGSSPDPDDPLIVLLEKTATGGWTATEVSDVADDFTRPIVVVQPGSKRVHVLATIMSGDTYRWTTSSVAPVFGDPLPWTTDDSLTIANVTSTKQPITAATGLVAMASETGAPHRYRYNVV